jgi:hypothetical protein
MSKTTYAIIYILFLFGLILLYQQYYLIISLISIQRHESIPSFDCSTFGFDNKSLNDVLIYDFFIFNNEFDMLEIRLYELYDYVNLFLIAESNLTLSGKPKPFYLKDNWAQFSRYHNKIRRVEIPLSKLINTRKDPWNNEQRMRDEGIRLALPNSTKYNIH